MNRTNEPKQLPLIQPEEDLDTLGLAGFSEEERSPPRPEDPSPDELFGTHTVSI